MRLWRWMLIPALMFGIGTTSSAVIKPANTVKSEDYGRITLEKRVDSYLGKTTALVIEGVRNGLGHGVCLIGAENSPDVYTMGIVPAGPDTPTEAYGLELRTSFNSFTGKFYEGIPASGLNTEVYGSMGGYMGNFLFPEFFGKISLGVQESFVAGPLTAGVGMEGSVFWRPEAEYNDTTFGGAFYISLGLDF